MHIVQVKISINTLDRKSAIHHKIANIHVRTNTTQVLTSTNTETVDILVLCNVLIEQPIEINRSGTYIDKHDK